MQTLFKSIVQGSGLYTVAMLGQRMGSLILLPVLTRFLTPGDYGVMELLDLTGSVLAILLGGNFTSALGYFYFQHDSAEGRRRVTGTTILGAALMGALAGLICWPLSPLLSNLVFGNDSATLYLHVLFLGMPLSFCLEALFGWLRVEDLPGTYVVWSFCRMAVTIVTIVLLVAVFQLKILGVLLSSCSTFLLVAAGMAIYCWRRMRPLFDLALFVRIAKFSAPIGLSGLALFVINFGDRFLLRPFVSLADLGLYALAYKIGMLVSIIFGSFNFYWGAQVYGIMKREDSGVIFARLHTYVTLGLSSVCLGLIVASRPLLHIMTSPAYFGAARLVPLIVLAYGIRSMGDFFRSLFYVAGRPGADAICNWLGAALCLAGYVVLIPRMGVWGAAIATVIAFALIGGICMTWTWRLRAYRLEKTRLLKIAAALAIALIPYSLATPVSLVSQISWAALAIALFPAALWVLGFLTAGEKDVIERVASRGLGLCGLAPLGRPAA